MTEPSSLGLRRSSLALTPLAVFGGCASDSSTGVSPSSPSHQLSESGNVFRIGGFEIGRDGVTEMGSGAASEPAPSDLTHTHASSQLQPAAAAAAGPPAGDFGISFADLQMLQIIGRGASGFVRCAEHLPSGTMMAVKEICISDPARRQQILKEVETLRAATARSASHLMMYLGVRYIEGSIQIAMEYMDGGSLGDLVHTLGPLPSDALSSITAQTLRALVELRECHLVHRDLKPPNILLSVRGDCKLSDFGCVAELQDSFGKCGTFVGTVPYMSPERIQGEEYSYASDVWALGLTLVECAVGHFPYARRNGYWGILQAVLKEPSPSLPPTHHEPALCDFVSYCLQKAPEARSSARVLLQHPFISDAEARAEHALRRAVRAAHGMPALEDDAESADAKAAAADAAADAVADAAADVGYAPGARRASAAEATLPPQPEPPRSLPSQAAIHSHDGDGGDGGDGGGDGSGEHGGHGGHGRPGVGGGGEGDQYGDAPGLAVETLSDTDEDEAYDGRGIGRSALEAARAPRPHARGTVVSSKLARRSDSPRRRPPT